MNALNQGRRALLCGDILADTPSLALQCARNVYRAVDRRMPEAAALAGWLTENAAAFGLSETALPADEGLGHSRRRGVKATDWAKGPLINNCCTTVAWER